MTLHGLGGWRCRCWTGKGWRSMPKCKLGRCRGGSLCKTCRCRLLGRGKAHGASESAQSGMDGRQKTPHICDSAKELGKSSQQLFDLHGRGLHLLLYSTTYSMPTVPCRS